MRSTLSFGLAALAASSLVAASPSDFEKRSLNKRATPPTDVEILNYALTLEHLEKNFYFQGLDKFSKADFIKQGFSAKTHARFQQIAIQEKESLFIIASHLRFVAFAHVTFLAGALGPAGVSQCKYDFSAVRSVKDFVAVSRILEGVGTAAYLGAAPDITADAYLAAAGSVLTVEARHTSYINELSGETGFPATFDSSLNYAQVYSLAAPFIIPGTCGAAKALPSSIQAFPALTFITKGVRSGHTSAIQFAAPSVPTYAAFIYGGATVYEPISTGADGVQRVNVPKGLDGVVYVVITTSASALSDSNTVAGPAVVFV